MKLNELEPEIWKASQSNPLKVKSVNRKITDNSVSKQDQQTVSQPMLLSIMPNIMLFMFHHNAIQLCHLMQYYHATLCNNAMLYYAILLCHIMQYAYATLCNMPMQNYYAALCNTNMIYSLYLEYYILCIIYVKLC